MRKYFLILSLLLLYFVFAKAQMPQLTVDGKTNNGVQLQALKIEVKVCGTVARTTWQMTFKNTTARILEGNLTFPLKNGLSVTRYALDINGKMREAVPVDRSKGTDVFEAIERRNVDPGLLEKVDGNTFRTRIYPINPNNTRTVLIGYEEELPIAKDAALHYYLPLNLKDTVADFTLNLSVIQTAVTPVFDSSLNENIRFSNSNNQYVANVHKVDYVPGYALSFSIPKPADAAEVMLQSFENNYCYLVNTTLQYNEREKKLPAVVGLLWDASLSSTNRNVAKEIVLLDAYFKKINTLSLQLVVFSNSIKSSKTYRIQNGNWDSVKKDIAAIQYDGATDFGKLYLKNFQADEFILMSDGHHTLGNSAIELGNQPVYCINSATTADYSNLKYIAGKTKGAVIDLQNKNTADALKELTNEAFRFLGIKPNDFMKAYYPSLPVIVNDNFSVAGIAEEGVEEITLQFGYGNKVTYEKTIPVNPETQLCENFDISSIYAQKKIAELDIQYDLHKQEIEKLGRQFGIVTRNTSLIVLDNINDYIQYGIAPPAELREQYNRIMKQRSNNIITKKQEARENISGMVTTLKEWYNKTTVKKETPKKEQLPVIAANTVQRNPAPVGTQRNSGLTPTPTGTNKIISGKVVDRDGNQIPFATSKIKGSSAGVSADATGLFAMRVKKGDVLEISGAGYNTIEIKIDTAAIVQVVLEKNTTYLREVVVTGAYGTRRSVRTLSSSVQTVSADEINTVQKIDIPGALQGKVAGVQVRSQSSARLGAETTVRLRGENGLSSGNTLYVVDGTIVPTYNINNKDVKDVTVLKAPAASALFGTDGVNGAIIINTTDFIPDSTYKKIQEKVEAAKDDPLSALNAVSFDYMKAIRQTGKANRYLKYLSLRSYYINKPTYFFETASYFLRTGDKENGLTILSNLAELENGSYELYKMLGYKLKEAGAYENELSAFKKVLELRPNDPQSFRDCALAYLDLGNYQQALDLLYEGMTKDYSSEKERMYEGIEEIFITEINHIAALYKNKVNLKHMDKKIILPITTDVRVVMNWNMNNTDIDLWVTDPNGEKCFYSHDETIMGGRISDDFTQGFGPEQFILKKGGKGKYKIEIDYYSDTQVTMAGPTTVMAEIYLHYGMPNEEKKIITLQMQKGKEGQVFIGEVEL